MVELVTAYPVPVYAFVIVFGLAIGSFLNVVIHRLPLMLEREWDAAAREFLDLPPAKSKKAAKKKPATEKINLISPRSRCPGCGHSLTALENIPLVSYVLQSGRCKSCRTPISLVYPLIEVVTALLFAAALFRYGATEQTLWMWGFVALALTLAAIDIDRLLLPDPVVYLLLWLGLAANGFAAFVEPGAAVIGAIAGYAVFAALGWAYAKVRGYDGLGGGDAKLLAALGAWVGWTQLPFLVLCAALIGIVIGVLRHIVAVPPRVTETGGKSEVVAASALAIPFGPPLLFAGALFLFLGPEILRDSTWFLSVWR